MLFEAPIAASLLGHFVSAVSGGSLYRKSSFLLDSLGKQVFSPLVQISELPHLPKGPREQPVRRGRRRDAAARRREGRRACRAISSAATRRASSGCKSTGNAGGNHNLILNDTGEDFAALLKSMGRGLLVTELMGQGVNAVTGDYSRGAAGFWVENGEIAYPGRGDHHRRQPEGHVPRDRRGRQRRHRAAARGSAARS